MHIKVFLLITILSISGCATSGQTTLLGLGIGTVVGGSMGALAPSGPKGRLRSRNTFIGTTIGAIVGAAIAYIVRPKEEKSTEKAELISDKKTMDLFRPKYTGDKNEPTLLEPRVETRYIDDQVRGNVFVPGHLEYQIVEPAQWRKE